MWYSFGAKQLWETRQDKKRQQKSQPFMLQESGVLMSPFLIMNPEPYLHQKASFPELAIWKSGSSELEPTGASQRRISSVSSLSFVLMWCHWQKTGEIKKVPFNLLSVSTGPVIHSTNLLNIYCILVTVLSDKRETYIVTCGCTFDAGKVPALLYTSLLKGVWMQTQNQTKHTGSKNRGPLLSWNQLSLCYTQKPYVCFYSAPDAFGSEITPSKIKLWFWAWP